MPPKKQARSASQEELAGSNKKTKISSPSIPAPQIESNESNLPRRSSRYKTASTTSRSTKGPQGGPTSNKRKRQSKLKELPAPKASSLISAESPESHESEDTGSKVEDKGDGDFVYNDGSYDQRNVVASEYNTRKREKEQEASSIDPTRPQPEVETLGYDSKVSHGKASTPSLQALTPSKALKSPEPISQTEKYDDSPATGEESTRRMDVDPILKELSVSPNSSSPRAVSAPVASPRSPASTMSPLQREAVPHIPAIDHSNLKAAADDGGMDMLQSVDCAEVIRILERLLEENPATDEQALIETMGNRRAGWKVPTHDALEFCLQVIKITPEAGRLYIASHFAGERGEELVDVQECRKFVSRIQGILYHAVQQRFTTEYSSTWQAKISRLSEFSCFLTEKKNEEARRTYQSTSGEDDTSDTRFHVVRLLPCFVDLNLQKDFWLFASHFTGIARLLEHDNTKFGPQKLEEYVYLEEPIAFEFARFAIAVVDKEKIAAPTQDTSKLSYEVIYDPEFFSNKDLLPLLSESGSTLHPKRDSDPPSPILLHLHHLLYRLLHESEAGRSWMKDPEWNKASRGRAERETTAELWADYLLMPKDPPYVKGEEDESEAIVRTFAPRECDQMEVDFDWDQFGPPEGAEEDPVLEFWMNDRLDESDREYTLKKHSR